MIFIIGLFIMSGFFVFGVISASKEERKRRIKERKGIIHLFGSFLYGYFLKIPGLTDSEKYRKADERERERDAVRTALLFFLLYLSLFAALLLDIKKMKEGQITEIHRPEFGETKSVSLQISGLEDEEQIQLKVLGKEPGSEEMDTLFDGVYESIMEEVLGENLSYSEITKDLELIYETDEGIEITYLSDNTEVISSRGRILIGDEEEYQDDWDDEEGKAAESEGVKTCLTVTLSYKTYRKSYRKEMVIYPKDRELSEKEQLIRFLQKANEEGREKEELKLPETYKDHKLSYSVKGLSPGLLPLFAFVLCIIFLFLPEEKKKEEKLKREELLMLSYPGLVSRLSILISANLSIRNAFERVLKEKAKACSTDTKKKEDPLYEQMLITWQNLCNGMAEKEAYADFGRRCGLHVYQRLCSMLEQNLRQGISGLEQAMKEELRDALNEKKNQALKKGEKAATRLLLPMMLMLGVIMVILMVPAFLFI